MRQPGWFRLGWSPTAESAARPGSRRDRLAVLAALVTIAGMGSVFVLSNGTPFLMPGPLASAHGAIKTCSTCHTKSGSSKVSWVHGLVAGDPRADSKACITCHKMPDTAFNAHSAPADVLKKSTERLTKTAAGLKAPKSARAKSIAFPTHDVVEGGLTCATCHQEHQGANFKLDKISNEQCRSCHVVKFDSFEGNHPKFDNYPFKRRTPIVYDHAGHFGKHYPELVKKDPAKTIPATCSTCHKSSDDKSVMAVAPFEQTCSTCHLDQISGNERASGPKGIAFLALPGLDLQSLKTKNAAIGEWPDTSDAALTPFMKVMISRNEQGRTLIKAVDNLNLQDLTTASDDQIKAVTDLVWEIKGLFHKLISGKASDALGDLNIGGGAKLSAALVADLTASIPRDVVISAQQQWLPNLAAEIAKGPSASGLETSGQKESSWSPVTTESPVAGSASPNEPSGPDAQERTSEPSTDGAESNAASSVKLDPPACVVRVLGQCLMFKEEKVEAEAAKPELAIKKKDSANAKADSGKEARSADELPPAMRAGVKGGNTAAQPDGEAGKTDTANATEDARKQSAPAGAPSPGKAVGKTGGQTGDQSDDLLFPTEDELREINAANNAAGKKSQPDAAVPADAASNAGATAEPSPTAATEISIASDVDPESWAEYGGWYKQDYEIFYRPTGHKDKFIYSWLFLTGPQAPKNDSSPAAAVFDFLTSKDAQGSCTKCHSVDDLQGKGRVVNFSQTSVESKQGRFTSFIHEPHFGTLENRGCLTCHKLEKSGPYLKSYEQGNPQSFASNFGAVKKDLCQTCHTSGMARQDCLTCHDYHVNGVITPIMKTKNPIQ